MLATGRGPRLAPHRPVGFDPALRTRRSQRMRRALRRRRRLRIGLVQAIFVAVALVLALLMPSLDAGPDIDTDTVTTLLFSLAGGLIALITLVFSLLFLVVPYANTSLSPRLTLFRDDRSCGDPSPSSSPCSSS